MRRFAIGWPQVAALGVVVAGLVAVAVWAPPATLEVLGAVAEKLPWEALAGLAATLLGVGASAALPPVVRRRPPEEGP